MYIDECNYTSQGRQYKRVLLRTGYREGGKVKHKTIANLSNCSDAEIEAFKIAFKMKKNLPALRNLLDADFKNGKPVGAVAALYQIANTLDIRKTLGNTKEARLVLWLIISRLIDQGSRLSAVRLADTHAAREIIGLESFNEDDLYKAMDWLYENHKDFEKKLFDLKHKKSEKYSSSNMFLYE